jgi:hypothetical protein
MARPMLVAALLAVLTTLAAPVATVMACSCVGWTRDEALAEADIAFVGTTTARVPMSDLDPDWAGDRDAAVFTFAIAEPLKGDLGRDVKIRAGGSEAACGQEFGLGETWFVLARANGAGFVTGLCSGSERARVPVVEAPVAPPADEAAFPLAPVGAGLALLAVAVVSALAFRRSAR